MDIQGLNALVGIVAGLIGIVGGLLGIVVSVMQIRKWRSETTLPPKRPQPLKSTTLTQRPATPVAASTPWAWGAVLFLSGLILGGAIWYLLRPSGDRKVVQSVVQPGMQRTLTGHSGRVTSVAFSPDGKTLASASEDATVKLWDAQTGTLKRTVTGHSSIVTSVAFSPDSKTLASISCDETVRLWDVQTGAWKQTLTWTSGGWVTSIAFSPDGKTLASGNSNATAIRLWNMQTGKLKQTLIGHGHAVGSLAFSRDGKTLASGSCDGVKLWDLQTGKVKRTVIEQSGVVACIAFSSDWKTLASGNMEERIGGTLWTGPRIEGSSEVKLWDVQTGTEQRTLTKRSGSVRYVAFSPDGKTLVSGSDSYSSKFSNEVINEVNLWDVQTGEQTRGLRWTSRWATPIAFSPDGKTVAIGRGDGTVKLWDISTGAVKETLTGRAAEAERQ